ncbi:MAG TPA: putative glycolipid-binding domain-containing protein [Candidatus Angelobacter sp.]|jgi:hypothetical protein|nr:putative glycolipid-binding domain-containing protein [Candidatus Angelobacter sp.]
MVDGWVSCFGHRYSLLLPRQVDTSKVMTLPPVVNRSGALWPKKHEGVTIAMSLMDSAPKLIASGLWRWLQGTGLERFEFLRTSDEWLFRGTIIALAGDAAVEAGYEIRCDHLFRTKTANISVRDSAGERKLQTAAQDGRWFENGVENQTVRGALDIDLGWSPSTNTLPIRRLGLEIGQASGEIIAAWVRFPELTLQPLPQQYLRLGDRKYRYSSRGGAFVAELLVDEHDLVLDYEGFWQRAPKMH